MTSQFKGKDLVEEGQLTQKSDFQSGERVLKRNRDGERGGGLQKRRPK